ncbi:hypothetical protein DFJ74DRAFT_721071 [Hyaloraphidium curvatum]|nr:hypothetical protein DFJ74DRAFT_721071 [Hyaloraphidium curvatum]
MPPADPPPPRPPKCPRCASLRLPCRPPSPCPPCRAAGLPCRIPERKAPAPRRETAGEFGAAWKVREMGTGNLKEAARRAEGGEGWWLERRKGKKGKGRGGEGNEEGEGQAKDEEADSDASGEAEERTEQEDDAEDPPAAQGRKRKRSATPPRRLAAKDRAKFLSTILDPLPSPPLLPTSVPATPGGAENAPEPPLFVCSAPDAVDYDTTRPGGRSPSLSDNDALLPPPQDDRFALPPSSLLDALHLLLSHRASLLPPAERARALGALDSGALLAFGMLVQEQARGLREGHAYGRVDVEEARERGPGNPYRAEPKGKKGKGKRKRGGASEGGEGGASGQEDADEGGGGGEGVDEGADDAEGNASGTGSVAAGDRAARGSPSSPSSPSDDSSPSSDDEDSASDSE